jgi:hypothetical protein
MPEPEGGLTMGIMNQARGYAYLFGVLKNQQKDPLCCSCNAFIKTLTAVRESLAGLDNQYAEDIGKLPREFFQLFTDAKGGIMQMKQPENPVSQKKAGNCGLPEGVCFTKTSLTILQKI